MPEDDNDYNLEDSSDSFFPTTQNVGQNELMRSNLEEVQESPVDRLLNSWFEAYKAGNQLFQTDLVITSAKDALRDLQNPNRKYKSTYAKNGPESEAIAEYQKKLADGEFRKKELEAQLSQKFISLHSESKALTDDETIDLLQKIIKPPQKYFSPWRPEDFGGISDEEDLYLGHIENILYKDNESSYKKFFSPERDYIFSLLEGIQQPKDISQAVNLSKLIFARSEFAHTSFFKLCSKKITEALQSESPETVYNHFFSDGNFDNQWENLLNYLDNFSIGEIIRGWPPELGYQFLKEFKNKSRKRKNSNYEVTYSPQTLLEVEAKFPLRQIIRSWPIEIQTQFMLEEFNLEDTFFSVNGNDFSIYNLADRKPFLAHLETLPSEFRLTLIKKLNAQVITDFENDLQKYNNEENPRRIKPYLQSPPDYETFIDNFSWDFSFEQLEEMFSDLKEKGLNPYKRVYYNAHISSVDIDTTFTFLKLEHLVKSLSGYEQVLSPDLSQPNWKESPLFQQWLIDGAKHRSTQELLNKIFVHFPYLYTPEIAQSGMTEISEKLQKHLLNSGQNLSEYSPTIINGLLISVTGSDWEKYLLEETQDWTQEDFDRLVQDLKKQIAFKNNKALSFNLEETILFVLNLPQVKEISDPDLLLTVCKYATNKHSLNLHQMSMLLEKFKPVVITEQPELLNFFIDELVKGNHKNVEKALAKLGYKKIRPEEIFASHPAILSYIKLFDVKTLDDFEAVSKNRSPLLRFLMQNPEQEVLMDKNDLPLISSTDLEDELELEIAKRCGISVEALVNRTLSEEDYKRLFEAFKENVPNWKSDIVNQNFELGVEIFGYKKMFQYITRRKINPETQQPEQELTVSRHDALHQFNSILTLYKQSGLSPKQFFGQILNQVKKDDSEYDEGTAHHHFNSIAQTFGKNFSRIYSEALKYKDVTEVQELLEKYDTPQKVFASWNDLKRFKKLSEVLKQAHILVKLQEIRTSGKEDLYQYIRTLAFHPSSKVDLDAVMLFWKYPHRFFDVKASHTTDTVHDAKKPTNYIDIPVLDLNAEELRDALVEGDMDYIQAFPAMEIEYEYPLEKFIPLPSRQALRLALGTEDEAGAAQSPKKIQAKIYHLLREYGLKVEDYLQGIDIEGSKREIIDQQIRDICYDEKFGIPKPKLKTATLIATIHTKSDPISVLAGNDTACCMPFGDGKNTVYTFNPNCAQFTLRLKRDTDIRTIAQSVLTKDIDIGRRIPEVLNELQSNDRRLVEVLPEEKLLQMEEAVLTCDNVEGNPSFTADIKYRQAIEDIYRDFFATYLSKNAQVLGLDPNRVIIGTGYSDALSSLPKVSNTFAPLAPVSYSDNVGAEAYSLDVTTPLNFKIRKKINYSQETGGIVLPQQFDRGVWGLTYEDALRIGFLEGKVYSDAKSLLQGMWAMENVLIAKDINNSAKKRPNLSLKYVNDQGKLEGYIVAYEGLLKENDIDDDQDVSESKEPINCIYIMDLAAHPESITAGGRLIKTFINRYFEEYLDQGNAMPIFAQAREDTSYKILKKQLDRIGRERGIRFELIEDKVYGDQKIHPVFIRPIID